MTDPTPDPVKAWTSWEDQETTNPVTSGHDTTGQRWTDPEGDHTTHPVEVLWLDACATPWDSHAWVMDAGPPAPVQPVPTCSVGYVYHQDTTSLTIMATANGTGWGQGITIPLAMVVAVRPLRTGTGET